MKFPRLKTPSISSDAQVFLTVLAIALSVLIPYFFVLLTGCCGEETDPDLGTRPTPCLDISQKEDIAATCTPCDHDCTPTRCYKGCCITEEKKQNQHIVNP